MFTGFEWGQVGHTAASALLLLVINPLLYIGIFLTVWDYSRNGEFERKFFSVRVTRALPPVLRMWGLSILLGLGVSLLGVAAGLVIAPREIWVVTALTILFGICRFRFFSPIYAISTVLLLSFTVNHVPNPFVSGIAGEWWQVLRDFHSLSWLGLLAMAMLAECTALAVCRKHGGFPVAVQSKRGRSIGAFAVKLSFIVPVVVASPGTGFPTTGLFTGWPWLSPQSSLSLVALPFLLGHAGLYATMRPQAEIRRIWRSNLILAIVLGAIVCVSWLFVQQIALAGAVIAVVVKEWQLWLHRSQENRLDPLFVPTPDGVRVLDVVKGSLAHAMGLLPGEVITHVNQVPVHTPYDLHFAFDQNPAYAKLQVVDIRGETRFVGNPVYSGERTKLGLILAPDSYDGPCLKPVKPGLFQTSYLRLASHTRNPEEAWLESQAAPPGR